MREVLVVLVAPDENRNGIVRNLALDALNDGFVYCALEADGWLEKWLHATYPESEFEVVNNS